MRHISTLRTTIALLVVAAALSACAGMGLPTPSSFNEKFVVAANTVTQVRTTALKLSQANRITVADEKNVLAQTDTARQGLDVARAMSEKDLGAANNKLDLSIAVLTALQAYLASR